MVIGELKPYIGEIARLLRQIAKSSCPCPTVTSAGTGDIPAGFRSISIVKTSSNSDSVEITLSDESVYTLTELGETFVQASEGLLPAYEIGGDGTFKWSGIK